MRRVHFPSSVLSTVHLCAGNTRTGQLHLFCSFNSFAVHFVCGYLHAFYTVTVLHFVSSVSCSYGWWRQQILYCKPILEKRQRIQTAISTPHMCAPESQWKHNSQVTRHKPPPMNQTASTYLRTYRTLHAETRANFVSTPKLTIKPSCMSLEMESNPRCAIIYRSIESVRCGSPATVPFHLWRLNRGTSGQHVAKV